MYFVLIINSKDVENENIILIYVIYEQSFIVSHIITVYKEKGRKKWLISSCNTNHLSDKFIISRIGSKCS